MHIEHLELVEALMPIVFGPPIKRVWRGRLIRLPRRQGYFLAVVNHWSNTACPIARATASSSPSSSVHLP